MAARVVRAESWALSERVLENGKSSLVLTDHSAAFPSISIDWFLAVSEAMGVPRFTAQLRRMFQFDNSALISIMGK
eukprot:5737111-Pyramimonas_sp.AAC.1